MLTPIHVRWFTGDDIQQCYTFLSVSDKTDDPEPSQAVSLSVKKYQNTENVDDTVSKILSTKMIFPM